MKTAFELIEANGLTLHGDIEHFAALVRADEREKFLGVLRQLHDSYSLASDPSGLRVRGDKHD
jgi:hypothetical protein